MSKAVLLGVVGGVVGFAGVANAGPVYGDYSTYQLFDSSNATITAQPLDGSSFGNRGIVTYSDMDPGPTGYVAFAAGGGALGFEDYTSTTAGSTGTLDTYRFVGGVTTGGMVLFFNFYDGAGAFIDGFGVSLANGGNFIYTISGGGGAPIGTTYAQSGFHDIVADDGSVVIASEGQWFLGDAGATVGSSDPTVGGSDPYQHNFELTDVPAPGTMALLGLGGLVATRRRR